MVDLVEKIIDKKELRGISLSFAQQHVHEWLKKHPEAEKEYEQDPERFYKKKHFQKMRSDIREHLRRVYGVFFTDKYPAKREHAITQLIQEPTTQRARDVLEIHRSTSERLPYYDSLYQQLFAITGKPESILDLGCGYNPFSYPFLGVKCAYHSVDIACEDLALVGAFHASLGIEHSQHCMDLTRSETVQTLPFADVTFAFKVFDSLEEKEWGRVQALLQGITTNWLIASFPTKSIGQKKDIGPRTWFEKLVTDKVRGRVTLPNEQFLIITLKKR